MSQEIFVGIDLGTTGTKIVFMDISGKILFSDSFEYPIITPRSGFAEQKPEDWWNGITETFKNAFNNNLKLKKNIACIGISGQMHTQVYLDSQKEVLRNAITWMDQRSKDIVEEYNKDIDNKEKILDITSNFLTTTYSAPNIIWVKINEKNIYNKVRYVLLPKDYVKFKLTDKMITDYSDAAGTMLFNVKKKEWSDELFNLFDIDRKIMPELASSKKIIGEVSAKASKETGILQGTPVINGCADHAATALGSGVYKYGEVVAILGTAGVISVVTNKPIVDPNERILCWNYCLEDKWVNLAVMQTAGGALNWFKNNFDSNLDNAFKLYDQKSSNIPDGCEGLIFLPYLIGERSPIWDSNARGVFFGINMNHSKFHFAKSIMEGVGFAFKNNIEVMESLGIDFNEVRFLGGGSKSSEWMRIMSRILNKKIISIKSSETGALGIGVLCGLGTGIYKNISEAMECLMKRDNDIYVSQEVSEIHEKNFNKYKKLYQKVKGLF